MINPGQPLPRDTVLTLPEGVTDEDLLSLDLLKEAERLYDAVARFFVSGILEEHVQRYFRAIVLQSSERFPRDEMTSDLSISSPFLLRAIVRKEVGPIVVTMRKAEDVVSALGRTFWLGPGELLVPGAPWTVEPRDAVLLGRHLNAREAVLWCGRNMSAAARGASHLAYLTECEISLSHEERTPK